jgi:hypothetical protein
MSYRRNRRSGKQRFETSPLPISVPVTRISDSSYGFQSARDRNRAMAEVIVHLSGLGIQVSTTDYRDTQSEYACQIIFWLDGIPGGCRLNSRGQFVSSVSRQVVASLIRG